MKKVSLYCTDNGSDKEYHLQIIQQGETDRYSVNFQYGRRGSTLKADTKTPTPVTLAEAEKIFNAKLKEQIGKGYKVSGETKDSYSSFDSAKPKEVIMLPQLLNSIEEEELKMLLNDALHLAQEKFDGERRLVISNGRVRGLNKKGTEVELPTGIVESIKHLDCIVDGEIVGEKLFVFDLLQKGNNNLKNTICRERIALLKSLQFGKNIEIAETAYTPSEKRKFFDKMKSQNHEGIVFKNKGSEYTPGRPNSGGNALKFKFVKTATFIVKSHTLGKRSVGLGLMDGEQLVDMGKVTVPAKYGDLPALGSFVEVRYLYAYKGGCIFQSVYLGKRPDSDLTDATIKQIVYKKEND